MKSKLRASPIPRASFLSLLSSLITVSILSFFVDALRRQSMPVPWPIILVMSTSCLTITLLLLASLTRCFLPTSTLLLLLFHLPSSILWIATVALLGYELRSCLTTSCPSSEEYGHDLALVCHLFKTLFSFTVSSGAASVHLVILDGLAWRRAKRVRSYTAMEKNAGGGGKAMGTETAAQPMMKRRKGKLGMFAGMFDGREVQEDERGIMMQAMRVEGNMADDILKPGNASPAMGAHVSPLATSPGSGAGQQVRVDGYAGRFDGQQTRYDPGSRMF